MVIHFLIGKGKEKHNIPILALLTRFCNHNICQWHSLPAIVVPLRKQGLISQLPSSLVPVDGCFFCCIFLRQFQAPLWHTLASLCRSVSNRIQQKQSRETCYSILTPSAAQSLLSRLTVLLVGQNFGSLSCCLYLLYFLSSGLWIKVL